MSVPDREAAIAGGAVKFVIGVCGSAI